MHLGAPEPTLLDLFARQGRQMSKPTEDIECIEQHVCCFNTMASLIIMKEPQRAINLVAYSSLTVKASQDYEGMPWKTCDVHLRVLTGSGNKRGKLVSGGYIPLDGVLCSCQGQTTGHRKGRHKQGPGGSRA